MIARMVSLQKLLIINIIFIFFLIQACNPTPNNPFNLHIWTLPDGITIKYYEKTDGVSGFTADYTKYLVLVTPNGFEKEYVITNTGGSNKSIELYFNAQHQIIWLKGKKHGLRSKSLPIAALDISRNLFFGDKFDWNKKDLTENEIKMIETIKSDQDKIILIKKKR